MDPVYYMILLVWTGLFWGLALWHKVSDFPVFVNVVNNYKLLPRPLILLASIAVVILELGVISLLFVNVKLGMVLAIALLAVYGFITAFNLLRGHRQYDCGCHWGKRATQQLSWWLPVRNVLLALIFSILFLNVKERSLVFVDFVNIVATLLIFPLMLLVIFGLLSNQRKFLESGYV